MKNTIQLLLFLCLSAISTGCATPYMVDRGRDAADIFTASIGIGGGAKVRVGPIQVGLLMNSDTAGLRGGQIIRPSSLQHYSGETLDFDLLLPIPSSASEWPTLTHSMESFTLGNGRKRFFATGRYVPLVTISRDPAYYTQIEAVIALGQSVRLGFNPGELLDFILGWTTIDIFSDDIEMKKEEK